MMPLKLRRKAAQWKKSKTSTALHARRTLCLGTSITWSRFVIGTPQAFAMTGASDRKG
jgi:hypothetical protein